jgi:hypothetical protein
MAASFGLSSGIASRFYSASSAELDEDSSVAGRQIGR